jgi:hypothetical protein
MSKVEVQMTKKAIGHSSFDIRHCPSPHLSSLISHPHPLVPTMTLADNAAGWGAGGER